MERGRDGGYAALLVKKNNIHYGVAQVQVLFECEAMVPSVTLKTPNNMPRVRIPRGSDMVSVTCYNQTENMTRQEALDKYYEAMVCCEGSERDRYLQIYTQLVEGCTECFDC